MFLAAGCGSAEQAVAQAPSVTVPASTAPTTATTSGCVNLAVSAATKVALAQAISTPDGQTVPGSTYYGRCGTTSYAATQIEAAPGAPLQSLVDFQGDGGATRSFVQPAGGAWAQVGTISYSVP